MPGTSRYWAFALATSCTDQPTAESWQAPILEPTPMNASTETEEASPSRTAAELHANLRLAIEGTRSMTVRPDDPLGEGEGFFDSDPRTPTDTIDCMTWLQWVLAIAYSSEDSDPLRWMDALRYYGSEVGFDTRKHYVDRWIWMDPGPLRPLPCGTEECPSDTIELEFDGLTRASDYPCPLWREEVRSTQFDSVDPSRLIDTIESLDHGFYVIFGVANDRYLTQYGEDSGPMGQVHPALMEVTEEHIEITHASTVSGRIDTISPREWMDKVRSLHRGTSIYSLDPNWDPNRNRLHVEQSGLCHRR